MRITFQYPPTQKGVDRGTTSQELKGQENIAEYQAIALDISGKVTDDFSFGNHGRLPEKVMQAVDSEQYVALQRNYMAVMSNSMSGRDFQKLQEEGFDVFAMDPKTTVTIVDKIKAALVQSGKEIQGYTDDLSLEKWKKIAGSQGYAQHARAGQGQSRPTEDSRTERIREGLSRGDVPLTEENIDQVEKAVELSGSLRKPGEETLSYMVGKGMEPTLKNLYQASFSAGGRERHGEAVGYASGGYDRLGVGTGGRRTGVSEEGKQQLKEQIETRIRESGIEVTEETKEQGKWLVERGIPLTKKNLELLDKLQKLSFPLEEEAVIEQAVGAIAEGQPPEDRVLTRKGTIYTQAVEIKNRYDHMTAEDIAGRRVLEEVRLRMTIEANLKLLESGFSIDTAPMEELIKELENASRKWEESLFGAGEESRGKGDLYRNTLEQLQKLPQLPITVIGKIPAMEHPTLPDIGKVGAILEQQYRNARESYETMMTAPRGDLGDSIKKAFRNVDEILTDMDLELTEENRRAVRIMGYNEIEISEDNLNAVKQADRQVRDLIWGMKPGVTLEMIREGKNPLEMSLSELTDYLGQRQKSFPQQVEKYSKFLYKLEKTSGISEEERKAYIGIYRLIRQIEKSDGAVIGSLVEQGAELNLSNLLSAVRTRKAKHTDIQIDDSIGLTKEIQGMENSISAQITESMESITEGLYLEEQMKELRQIAGESGKWESYLKQYHQTPSLNALQSVAVLNEKRGSTFRKVTEWEEEGKHEVLQKADELLSELEKEETREQNYDKLIDTAEMILETAVEHLGTEAGYVDIKGIQMLCKQLHTAKALAKEENYEIPVQIGEEVTSVNLKILHRREHSGEVKITMDCEKYGKVEARFQVMPDGLEGSVLTDYMDGKEALEESRDFLTELLNEALAEETIEVKALLFGTNDKLDLNRSEANEPVEASVSTGLLYKAAKGFLTFIRQA